MCMHILLNEICFLWCRLSHIYAFLENLNCHLYFFRYFLSNLFYFAENFNLFVSIVLSTGYRSFVGFWGNLAQLMEDMLLPISLGSYVMWQRHILMMKLLRYPLKVIFLLVSKEDFLLFKKFLFRENLIVMEHAINLKSWLFMFELLGMI